MPLQNRVTPFSTIEADPARGMFMGNRGCLHGEHRNLEVEHTREKRWLVCLTSFKGRKRRIMQPGHYTELFFLDEATALAAGHRPCAECRRQAYDLFLKLYPGKRANAETLDKYLASDRLRPWPATFGELPEGTMFAVDADAFLKWRGKAWRWHHAGYKAAEIPDGTVEVLTPEGTVAALAAGYKPVVHGSAR
ncbi:MAG: hypothetical protein ING44_13120 [Telmatospirillum sp.]|nr:hypothetical protein [Telmatospirillum sp.]